MFANLLAALQEELDLTTVDGRGDFYQVPAARSGPEGGRSPAESRQAQALGRSRGELTTKLLALTYGRGQLVQLRLKPGNVAEGKELPALLADVPLTTPRELLGDKAYDNDRVRRWLAPLNLTATIPGRSHRKEPVGFDEGGYQRRSLVENAFSNLRQFRGIACRYVELAASYAGMVSLVAWFLSLVPQNEAEPAAGSGVSKGPAVA